MAYEITGRVKVIQGAQTFNSSFTKREMVIEVEDGKYKQEINIEFHQDRVSLLDNLTEGQDVVVTFDIRGREHNGRWFNNLVGWKVAAQASAPVSDRPPLPADDAANDDGLDDDVPF